MTRTLVAGVGKIFFGDDGFGCEVARRLDGQAMLDGVAVVDDFGIRGLHLAYELTSGDYAPPSSSTPSPAAGGPERSTSSTPRSSDDAATAVADAHGIDLGAVFAMTRTLGPTLAHVVVVGCDEAGEILEGIGLSGPPTRAGGRSGCSSLVKTLLSEGARAVAGGRP